MTKHETVTLTVPGMTCGHCRAAIEHEVGGVDGVTDVMVDLESKLVTVAGSGLDRDTIIGAIDEAGFDAT